MPAVVIERHERRYDEMAAVGHSDGTELAGGWVTVLYYKNPAPMAGDRPGAELQHFVSDRAVWNRMGIYGATKREALAACVHESLASADAGPDGHLAASQRPAVAAAYPVGGQLAAAAAAIPDPPPGLVEWAQQQAHRAYGRARAAELRGVPLSDMPIAPGSRRHPQDAAAP